MWNLSDDKSTGSNRIFILGTSHSVPSLLFQRKLEGCMTVKLNYAKTKAVVLMALIYAYKVELNGLIFNFEKDSSRQATSCPEWLSITKTGENQMAGMIIIVLFCAPFSYSHFRKHSRSQCGHLQNVNGPACTACMVSTWLLWTVWYLIVRETRQKEFRM